MVVLCTSVWYIVARYECREFGRMVIKNLRILRRKLKMDLFNLERYSDGLKRKFGNEYEMPIEEAVESLMHSNEIAEKWTEDELTQMLVNMDYTYQMVGSRFSQIKITKTK